MFGSRWIFRLLSRVHISAGYCTKDNIEKFRNYILCLWYKLASSPNSLTQNGFKCCLQTPVTRFNRWFSLNISLRQRKKTSRKIKHKYGVPTTNRVTYITSLLYRKLTCVSGSRLFSSCTFVWGADTDFVVRFQSYECFHHWENIYVLTIKVHFKHKDVLKFN